VSCPHCGAEVPAEGPCPSCRETTADAAASAITDPALGPPPRGLSANGFRVAPGQRFGERFTLIEEIGAGGMGQVYKAIDLTLGKTVALKLVRARSGPQEQIMERFRRELTLAREVTHPNVCRVYDLGQIDGALFISMEYVEGQSLDDLIQSVGTLSTKQTIALARQICAGLEAIHFRKIVHRDLKPANIMVDRAGRPILMDFGLAYAHGHDRLTGEGAVLGTLAYLSPEQARGQSTDARTDIYAVGLILYEMLTGRRAPGDGGSAPLALRDSAERCPPPSRFSPDVPAELDGIVLRCLERDPARRFASSLELETALARLAATLSSGVTTGRTRISAPKGRMATVASVVVVVAALVGAAQWWRPSGPHLGPEHPVIAVLPLVTIGSAPDDHLGIGMADTLIAHLAGIPSLTVVSRTATAGGDGPQQVRRLAHELGADYVVSGSVVRVDRRMNVTATLLRPDDSVAWGAHYEGSVDDVFSLQRRLAEGVSAALAVRLTANDRARLARPATSEMSALTEYSDAQALLERPEVPGNVGRAIDTFRRAIALDPKFALAHAGLGRAYWQQYLETRDPSWPRLATDSVTEALRLDPAEPGTRLALATVYAGTGRADAAADELRKLIDRQPSNDDAHRQLGEILAGQSRWEEAIAELRTAVDLRPRFGENLSRLGLTLDASGRYAEAVVVYKQLADLQPDSSRSFQRLGSAYEHMGQDDLALQNYRRALALTPDAKAFTNVGTIEFARGRYPEAAAAFAEAARLEPRNPIAQRNLGDVYAQMGRRTDAERAYHAAVAQCEDLLRVNPRDARMLARLAAYEAKLGRLAAADRHAIDALSLSPADGEILYRKAVVEALSGRADAALSSLREAVSRGYSPARARTDHDLASLQGRPEFAAALAAPR
jgi:tetratricopeptide (TPR) repeat protein/TolB-like protein/tRNA A-37 threonylcarbamoyl transferase component Bud32